MPRATSRKSMLILVYLASFLYSFHYALPLYVESSFIAEFLPTEKSIGIIFSIAALFTTVLTFLFPRFLRAVGNYAATLITMGLEIFALLSLAFFSSPAIIIPFFILHQTVSSLIFLNLDEFVESFSNDKETGGIRGIFMTILNIAVAGAPFLAGLMLSDHDFWKVYLAGALSLAFGFLVIAKYFRTYTDPHYRVPRFKETLRAVAQSHDLHSIIFMHFLLSLFFSWMVIYTPFYLNKHIGIPMNDILGFIIPIALLPFILFETILGKIADARLGEKEILTAGFLIMAFSTMSITWISSTSIALWALALFITRTGASAVESMTESYFYKKVGPEDVNIIMFMRMMRASAYIVGPLFGSIALAFIDYRFLFLSLGITMLLALPYSLTIKDTK